MAVCVLHIFFFHQKIIHHSNATAMNTLLRSTTARFSPSPLNIYVPLDDSHQLKKNRTCRRFNSQRSSSKRNKRSPEQPISLPSSFSYRRHRARQRQIFLKTYKLSLIESSAKSWPRKLVKKAFLKLRRVAVRVVSIVRIASLRSCSCISGVINASPRRGLCL